MSKLTGFLILSGEQFSINAESTSQRIVQRKINSVFILVNILCHHRSIGIIFKINRIGKRLFQKTEAVIFDLKSVGFHHKMLFLADDPWNGYPDSQKFFRIFHAFQKFFYQYG